MGIRQLKAEIKQKEAAIELNKNLSHLAFSQLKDKVERKMSLPLLGVGFALGFFGVSRIFQKKSPTESKKNISKNKNEPIIKQNSDSPLAATLDIVKLIIPLLPLFIKRDDH